MRLLYAKPLDIQSRHTSYKSKQQNLNLETNTRVHTLTTEADTPEIQAHEPRNVSADTHYARLDTQMQVLAYQRYIQIQKYTSMHHIANFREVPPRLR